MKKKILQGAFMALVLLVGTLFLAGCSNTEQNRNTERLEPLTKIKASYIPITAHFPLYVAQEEGYFKKKRIRSRND